MEARSLVALALMGAAVSLGADFRTPNFIVNAPTAELAQEIGREAERLRRELAIEWLGRELPNWYQPCPIQAHVREDLGAGGETSFVFDQGQVFGWRMVIQGSRQRVLDSVLPHEITHTIFASHFRQALPRWADEGACSTVEHTAEQNRHQRMLVQFLQTGRGIAFNRMFTMMQYPHDIMPLYAQGYSLARYLIQQGGRRKYVEFVGEGLRTRDWTTAIRKYYGVNNLGELQTTWLAWVRSGSPELPPAGHDGTQLASATPSRRPRPNSVPIYRGQSPDSSENRGEPRMAANDNAPVTRVPAARVAWPPSDAEAGLAEQLPRWTKQSSSFGQPGDRLLPSPEPALETQASAYSLLDSPDFRPRRRPALRGPRQVLLEWSREDSEGDSARAEDEFAAEDEFSAEDGSDDDLPDLDDQSGRFPEPVDELAGEFSFWR